VSVLQTTKPKVCIQAYKGKFMTIISQFFEDDHRRLDQLFEQFQQASGQTKLDHFDQFTSGLLAHIDWEENLLFPAVEKSAGFQANAGPTHVMRIEHEQIKQCLVLIKEKLADEANAELLESRLLDILAEHNFKEERILYPTCDNTIAKKDADTLVSQCLILQ
jgi:regulator of cell morphogenesis and NO signaling